MDLLLAGLAGLIVGAAITWFLSRDAAGRADRSLTLLTQMLTGQTEAQTEQRKGDQKTILELAHKVSAPQQAEVDHVFDGERERRKAEKDAEDQKVREQEVNLALARAGLTQEDIEGAKALM